jgi:hypothetical protein
LVIALGATAGVALVAGGIALGLHSTGPGAATPFGVVPVTGETPTDPSGGLVSGDKPAAPHPVTGPPFAPTPPAPDALPPAPATDPQDALPPLPPDPFANDPSLKAPNPPAALPPPPASSAGLPADDFPDDLGDSSSSGGTGLEDPSYGPANAAPPAYRPAPPRYYGTNGYRDRDRSNGPLGSLGDRDNRPGGPRRGPMNEVPGIGGLGH